MFDIFDKLIDAAIYYNLFFGDCLREEEEETTNNNTINQEDTSYEAQPVYVSKRRNTFYEDID